MDGKLPLQWRKLGKVFGPEMGPAWMKSHAQVPTPLHDEAAGIIRVYFSSRPENGVSLTSYVDLDAADPLRVLYVHQQPLLELGLPGSFDEHGIMPSCAVRHGALVYLYYSGWSRATTVPYTNSTGLAISTDGGCTFRRAGTGPILGKSLGDPYSATSPFVLHDGTGWRMWYCSGTGWPMVDGKYEHVYDIKEALSDDGIFWRPSGKISLEANETEQALTRPWVTRVGDDWLMHYCQRQAGDFRDGKGAYRIAAARSRQLDEWQRIGADGPSSGMAHASDWDGLAQAYPGVVRVGSRLLMFYNGNGFGASGFGVAVAEIAPETRTA